MFRIFLALINLELALGLTEVYGAPPVAAGAEPTQEFHTQAVQPVEDHKLFFVPQNFHGPQAGLPGSRQEQSIRDNSPPVPTSQYGQPRDNQPLKESYSRQGSQQSFLGNSDKSLQGDQVRKTYNLESSQDATNEELIASFKPPMVSRHSNEQETGLEYANYAPYHQSKSVVSGTTKSDLPSFQQDVKYGIPRDQSPPETSQYNADSYQSSRAQILRPDNNNGYNDGAVTNHYKEATGLKTPESEGPSYPNYHDSQDIQRPIPETAFQNPSYQIPNYDASVGRPQDTRIDSPAYQTSISGYQNEKPKYEVPEFSSPVNQQANYVSSSYSSLDAQNTKNNNEDRVIQAPRISSTYGVPPIDSSDYSNSLVDNSAYKSSGAGNQVGQRKPYDSSYQRYASSNAQYKTPAYQEGGYARHEAPAHQDSVVRGKKYQADISDQNTVTGYETPVRYIAVLQKHRAPGRADISTASYLTQAVQNQPQSQALHLIPLTYNPIPGQSLVSGLQKADIPIVLPISSYYYSDSPTGSISSTFISKDVGAYQRQPAYIRPLYRENPTDSNVNNLSPQTNYGLPNF